MMHHQRGGGHQMASNACVTNAVLVKHRSTSVNSVVSVVVDGTCVVCHEITTTKRYKVLKHKILLQAASALATLSTNN